MSTKKTKSSKSAKSLTKSQLISEIAKSVEQPNTVVTKIFDELAKVIETELVAGRTLTFYGLFKLKVNRKPATKARMGRNPSNGQQIMFKAKPARNVVRISPLKKLKSMVL